MSKSIKVSEAVYMRLLGLQRVRETFTDTIARLIMARDLLSKVEPLIRGQTESLEQKRQDLEAALPVDRRGDSPEVPHVPSREVAHGSPHLPA